jgi:hypothetical protein
MRLVAVTDPEGDLPDADVGKVPFSASPAGYMGWVRAEDAQGLLAAVEMYLADGVRGRGTLDCRSDAAESRQRDSGREQRQRRELPQ